VPFVHYLFSFFHPPYLTFYLSGPSIVERFLQGSTPSNKLDFLDSSSRGARELSGREVTGPFPEGLPRLSLAPPRHHLRGPFQLGVSTGSLQSVTDLVQHRPTTEDRLPGNYMVPTKSPILALQGQDHNIRAAASLSFYLLHSEASL